MAATEKNQSYTDVKILIFGTIFFDGAIIGYYWGEWAKLYEFLPLPFYQIFMLGIAWIVAKHFPYYKK